MMKFMKPASGWNRWIVIGAIGGLIALAAFAAADPRIRLSTISDERIRDLSQLEYRAGRADKAVKYLTCLRKPTPVDLFFLAEMERGIGRKDSALRTLARIEGETPVSAGARRLEGMIHHQSHRLVAARKALIAALKIEPADSSSILELIDIDSIWMRRFEAAQKFKQLSEIRSLPFDLTLSWSQRVCGLWNPEEIETETALAVKADPSDNDSRLALVAALTKQKRYDEAEAALAAIEPEAEKALKWEVAAARGSIAIERNDEEGAAKAIAGAPEDFPAAALIRARLARRRGKFAEAAAGFEAVLKAEPDNRTALEGFGLALMSLGKKDEAKRILDRAVIVTRFVESIALLSKPGESRDDKLIRQIAATAEKLGYVDLARAWYKVILERSPLDDQAQEAIYRLRKPGI
jgi:tetratricopeptide (TPR) repeat protein